MSVFSASICWSLTLNDDLYPFLSPPSALWCFFSTPGVPALVLCVLWWFQRAHEQLKLDEKVLVIFHTILDFLNFPCRENLHSIYEFFSRYRRARRSDFTCMALLLCVKLIGQITTRIVNVRALKRGHQERHNNGFLRNNICIVRHFSHHHSWSILNEAGQQQQLEKEKISFQLTRGFFSIKMNVSSWHDLAQISQGSRGFSLHPCYFHSLMEIPRSHLVQQWLHNLLLPCTFWISCHYFPALFCEELDVDHDNHLSSFLLVLSTFHIVYMVSKIFTLEVDFHRQGKQVLHGHTDRSWRTQLPGWL